MFGEVVKIIEVNAQNGKTYSIVIGTRNEFISSPRPESIEEFDRYYAPAMARIMSQMARMIQKEGN